MRTLVAIFACVVATQACAGQVSLMLSGTVTEVNDPDLTGIAPGDAVNALWTYDQTPPASFVSTVQFNNPTLSNDPLVYTGSFPDGDPSFVFLAVFRAGVLTLSIGDHISVSQESAVYTAASLPRPTVRFTSQGPAFQVLAESQIPQPTPVGASLNAVSTPGNGQPWALLDFADFDYDTANIQPCLDGDFDGCFAYFSEQLGDVSQVAGTIGFDDQIDASPAIRFEINRVQVVPEPPTTLYLLTSLAAGVAAARESR